jgi:hypothetical protein
MDVGDDDDHLVIIRQSSATDGGQGRHRQRGSDQGCRSAGLLSEDGSRALLILHVGGAPATGDSEKPVTQRKIESCLII